MNKKLIRLTEGDLRRIVKESVNRVLNELSGQLARKAELKRQKTIDNVNNYPEYSPYDYDEYQRIKRQKNTFADYVDDKLSKDFTPFGVIGCFIDENDYSEEPGISYEPLFAELGKDVDDLYDTVSDMYGKSNTPSLIGIFAFTRVGEGLAWGGSPNRGIVNPQTTPESRINLWNFLEELEKKGSNRFAIRIA